MSEEMCNPMDCQRHKNMDKERNNIIVEAKYDILNNNEILVVVDAKNILMDEQKVVVVNENKNNLIPEPRCNIIAKQEMFIYFLNSNDVRCKKIRHGNEIYYYARSIFNYFTSISHKTCFHFALNTVDKRNKFTISQLKLKHKNILLDNNQNFKQLIQFDDAESYLNEQGLSEFLDFLHNIEPEQFKRRLSINSLPTVMENND